MPLLQEDKEQMFKKLRTILQKFAPPMVISKETTDVFELIGNKPVPYGSKKEIVPGMYFSSIVARKDMISFYFFPIYFREAEFISLIPNSVKYLKGKTCFNFKKPDQIDEKELTALLKKGAKAWQDHGYMK